MGANRRSASAARAGRKSAKKPAATSPGWRRIEAIRERTALRGELADIWSEDPEFDESIFFPDEETSRRFYAGAKLDETEFEINEDEELLDEEIED